MREMHFENVVLNSNYALFVQLPAHNSESFHVNNDVLIQMTSFKGGKVRQAEYSRYNYVTFVLTLFINFNIRNLDTLSTILVYDT